MAVLVTIPNKTKVNILKGVIDFSADTFKLILMAPGFGFDRVNHVKYADVAASELPTLHGYTAGGYTLAGVSVTQDNTNNKAKVTWSVVTVSASGGDLTASGAIIYDDTVTSPDADPIIEYIDFGGPQVVASGTYGTISNLEFDGA